MCFYYFGYILIISCWHVQKSIDEITVRMEFDTELKTKQANDSEEYVRLYITFFLCIFKYYNKIVTLKPEFKGVQIYCYVVQDLCYYYYKGSLPLLPLLLGSAND